MNDFIKQQELIQSKLKGISGLIGVTDKNVQLALLEINQIGLEKGRKEGARNELENEIKHLNKLQNIAENEGAFNSISAINSHKISLKERLKELE